MLFITGYLIGTTHSFLNQQTDRQTEGKTERDKEEKMSGHKGRVEEGVGEGGKRGIGGRVRGREGEVGGGRMEGREQLM